MKITLTYLVISILSFTQIITLTAQNNSNRLKAANTYSRLMEQAHPTPLRYFKQDAAIPLAGKSLLPIFLNVNMTEPESDQYKMQNESSIAVNPKNPLNLISSAVDYRAESSTWVYVSTNGGQSWVDKNLGKPFPGWRSTNDPSVAFDPDGTGYLVYGGFGTMDSTGLLVGENGVFIARTTDEGYTWTPHIPVIIHRGPQTLDSNFEDKYYISIDNSPSSPYYKHLYIPWKRVVLADSSTQIVISKSTDKGSTWSIPVNVSDKVNGSSEDTTFGQSFPICVTGPNGEVYVVWNHGIAHGVGFAKSMDGCVTFSEPRIIKNYNIFGQTKNISSVDTIHEYRHTVKGKVRAEAYPSITCDTTNGPKRGTIYLSWSADNPPNVYFSESTDGGDSWSNSKIVHTDTTNDQFWHWLALDPKNGDLAVMYLDSRNDSANINVECYVSYSSDGGDTWIDRRASDFAGDLRNNPFGGNSFAGDYSGIAFYHGMIYPSWIDMRASETNIFDSDVYTALINTQMPAPVDSFKVTIIPENPQELTLAWVYSAKRAFGQPMANEEYHFALFRDGQFLTDVQSQNLVYQDNNLTPYQKYDYSIVVVSEKDSSLNRNDGAFAGGSRLPSAPGIISLKGSDSREVTLDVKLPSFREDNVVPLVNLSKVALYRDSIFVNDFTFNTTDTGKTVQINDTPNEKGYYNYFVKALDSSAPPNESQQSNEMNVFTGTIDNKLTESFDEIIGRYINIGGWGVNSSFYHSSPNSFTESPLGDYKSRQNYTLDLYPVSSDSNNNLVIEFWHAAIVHRSDTAFIEVSFDDGTNWSSIAKFNQTDYPSWNDKVLNNQDWKYEKFDLSKDHADTAIFRFGLKTNVLSQEDGWYIDDIKINGSPSSVNDEYAKQNLILYPNPSDRFLVVRGIENINISEVKVISAIGKNLDIQYTLKDSEAMLDVSGLSNGIYVIEVVTMDSQIYYEKFVVYR
ncbi:MAG: T9SS type A sorting domain-containing protein [Ignavibacteriae bacterium]|nr:T9SS type A sorting domain-containing protein [Ignavibacteriota bacterium]